MNVKEFMRKTQKLSEAAGYTFQEIRPRIVCGDGVSLSVQGSHTHYCAPREDGCGYYLVEVGYPSIRPPKEWGQYYEGTWQTPTLLGSLSRVWKHRGMIVHILFGKNWKGMRRTIGYYASLKDNATTSVYGYVPIELVDSFIESHGGIDEAASLPAHDQGLTE